MKEPKVLVVCITKDFIDHRGMTSLMHQEYWNYSVLIHAERPKVYHENKLIQRLENIASNRNQARRLALASDAEYFLFVDSDMSFPKTMIRNLVRNQRPVVGGWYPMNGSAHCYVAGRYIADCTFQHFRSPEIDKVTTTDLVGLGCCLVRRDVLSKVKFRGGVNETLRIMGHKSAALVGESLAFSNDASEVCRTLEKPVKIGPHEAGKICLVIDGSVVCNHYPRE